jgi:hypothetical protein
MFEINNGTFTPYAADLLGLDSFSANATLSRDERMLFFNLFVMHQYDEFKDYYCLYDRNQSGVYL